MVQSPGALGDSSDGSAAPAHVCATRDGEVDGKRSFRLGSRKRRLLAAYRDTAGYEAEAIDIVDGDDHRRAGRAQCRPNLRIPSRYSGLVSPVRFGVVNVSLAASVFLGLVAGRREGGRLGTAVYDEAVGQCLELIRQFGQLLA